MGQHVALPDQPVLDRRAEKAGTNELLIDNLPGYCDNINRASDGKYWLAFVGLRSPVYDLAMQQS